MNKEPFKVVNPEGLAETIIVVLPEIQARMFSLLGRRPQNIPQRYRVPLERKCRTLVRAMTAQLEKLTQSAAQAEPVKLASDLESFLAMLVRARGIRRKRGEDTLDLLLRFTLSQTVSSRHPWTKTAVYEDTRRVLRDFVVHLHQRYCAPAIQTSVDRWAEKEGENYIAFVRQLETAAKRFRARPPLRLTDRLVVDLQDEYRLASAFFEHRLRLLLYLSREGSPKSKPWSDWRKEHLNNLLQMAKSEPDLAALVGAIDRHVRNALAHGAPAIDMVTGCCEFEDSRRKIRWTFEQFFDRTRSLTITAAALGSLEPFLEYAHAQWLVYVIRSLRAVGLAQEARS